MLSKLHRSYPFKILSFSIVSAMLVIFPSMAVAMPGDMKISDRVEDELEIDAAVSAQLIDVETHGGIVTLSGTVNNLLAKERAARIAETVKSVRSVVNTIIVSPTPIRSDGAIKADVKNALLYDPATDSYEVGVEVKNNVVTLTGNVDSWQEKQLCAKTAKSVPGVIDLKNNIQLVLKIMRPESEISADIERTLHWDTFVDDSLIHVSVDGGTAELRGVVGSAAEKRRAVNLAYVAGVQKVEADQLMVERWARDPELRKDKYGEKNDVEIRDAVEDALIFDTRVASFKIDAEVEDRVVTLRGTVDNLKSKRAAEMDARGTVGVLGVNNRIKVRPKKMEKDELVKGLVKEALQRDADIESYKVTVSVRNGIVDLSGSVKSYYDKARADDIASRVAGVIAVNNDLVVSNRYEPYVYNPYIDDWRVENYPWFVYKFGESTKSDREIRKDIESEFFWSPFVDSDAIHVSVNHGVAELTGTVDSWSEFYAASENAFEGGAVSVDNNLIVK